MPLAADANVQKDNVCYITPIILPPLFLLTLLPGSLRKENHEETSTSSQYISHLPATALPHTFCLLFFLMIDCPWIPSSLTCSRSSLQKFTALSWIIPISIQIHHYFPNLTTNHEKPLLSWPHFLLRLPFLSIKLHINIPRKAYCTCFFNFLPFLSPQPALVKCLFSISALKLFLSSSLRTSRLLNPMVSSQTLQHLTCQPCLRRFIAPFSLNTFFTWLPGPDASGFLPTSLAAPSLVLCWLFCISLSS